jgi:hypothetical protein
MRQRRLTVCVTRWWVGVDSAHYIEKCLGIDSAPLNAANPTSRVHALLAAVILWRANLINAS